MISAARASKAVPCMEAVPSGARFPISTIMSAGRQLTGLICIGGSTGLLRYALDRHHTETAVFLPDRAGVLVFRGTTPFHQLIEAVPLHDDDTALRRIAV